MKLPLKFNVIALLILAYQQTCTGNPLAVIMAIKDISDKVTTGVEFITTAMGKDETSQILDKVNGMVKEINYIKRMIEDSAVIMFQKLLPEIAAIQSLEILKNEIRRSIEKVNQEYEEHFLEYSKADFSKISSALDKTILNWSFRMIDDTTDNYLETYLLNIQRMYNNYLKELIALMNKSKHRCVASGQSPQLMIAYQYSNFALLQLKGFLIIKYSNEILGARNRVDTKGQIDIASKNYQRRVDEIRRDLINNIDGLSREFWRCDPDKHTNETWGELQVFEKFLINTKDLQTNLIQSCPSEARLSDDCERGNCVDKDIRMCDGKIAGCYTIGSEIKVCPNEPNSYKRYKYIISYKPHPLLPNKGEKEVFGEIVSCPNEKKMKHETQTGNIVKAWHPNAYCMCDCSIASSMNNNINLAPAFSDYKQNKVVTGVKLVLEKRLWSFKIQQGVLGPKGTIDEKTVGWKDVHYENLNGYVHHKVLGHGNYRMYMYDTMANRKNSVLIGVKFQYEEDKGLIYYAKFADFDFETGKLGDAIDERNENDFGKGSEIKHIRHEMPMNTEFKSDIISKQNDYIHFQTSTLHEDISQTTIPLLDIQPVEPIPHVPLSGFGVYHKNRLSSGFVGLKVYTFDYSQFFK